jgi:type I restriction enzyme, S subunit
VIRTILPHGWKKAKLGEYFRIKHGFAFKGEFFADKGPYILLTPGNFNPDGGIKLKGEKEKYYTGDFPLEFLLKRGDFLIVLTDLIQNAPILGSPAFVKEDNKFLHNQRLGKITNLNDSKMYPLFLYYLFNSAKVRDQIKASATGATVKHTAPERIYAVEVELPPISTQRKIAAILSSYDDLIENNTRRIAILENMAQALYREWFVQFRYPGHEKRRMVESALGMIPEGWEVKALEYFGAVVTGKTPSKLVPEYFNEEYMPFVKTPDLHGNIFCIQTEEYLSEKGALSQKNKTIPPNSLCVNCIGAKSGAVSITTSHCQTNQQINSIILNELFIREFLYFELVDLKETIRKFGSNGATMVNLNKGKFEALRVIFPERSIIANFHNITFPMFEEIRSLQLKNANLRRTRDLLLPKLISGEIDVEGLDIETGEGMTEAVASVASIEDVKKSAEAALAGEQRMLWG